MNSNSLNADAATFDDLYADGPQAGSDLNLDMILDVPVALTLEVGRTRMPIRNLLQLNQGSVIELERGAWMSSSTAPWSPMAKWWSSTTASACA
jgi:flagellar motor switch protein FliN